MNEIEEDSAWHAIDFGRPVYFRGAQQEEDALRVRHDRYVKAVKGDVVWKYYQDENGDFQMIDTNEHKEGQVSSANSFLLLGTPEVSQSATPAFSPESATGLMNRLVKLSDGRQAPHRAVQTRNAILYIGAMITPVECSKLETLLFMHKGGKLRIQYTFRLPIRSRDGVALNEALAAYDIVVSYAERVMGGLNATEMCPTLTQEPRFCTATNLTTPELTVRMTVECEL